MSRKRTSARLLSSQVSTSRPSRHSPTTTNSSNGSINCRTPRRAMGSSSAISTRHLAIGIGHHLAHELMVRNAEPSDRTRSCAGGAHVENGAFPVERSQSLAGIGESVTGARHIAMKARAVVSHNQLEHLVDATCDNANQASFRAPRDAVTNGILHEMLQREARYRRTEQRWIDIDLGAQAIGKARLLHREVVAHQIQLLFQRYFARARSRERAPEHIAQMFDDGGGALGLFIAHQDCHRVQAVEEKMR